jgi:rod shape-determining protein MreC
MFFKRNRTRLLLAAVLLALAAGLFLYRSIPPDNNDLVTKTIRAVIMPIQAGLGFALSSFVEAWQRYLFLVGRERENEHLRAENQQYRERVSFFSVRDREQQLEIERLRKLLGAAPVERHRMVMGRVISRTFAPFIVSVVIDQGQEGGIQRGQVALTEAGLAGRVTEVSAGQAEIMLITSRLSNVDAIIQEERIFCILQGTNFEEGLLKYVPRDANVKAGDWVLTSGTSRAFPPGLPLGQVTRVNKAAGDLFQEVYLRPALALSRLEELIILVPLKGSGK